MPGDRLFAGRTKRAARLVNRKIGRPAINADVQKRSHRRTEHEGERVKEKFVTGMIHADYSAIDRALRRSINHAIQMQLSYSRHIGSAIAIRVRMSGVGVMIVARIKISTTA